MLLHLYRTDGQVDVAELCLADVAASKVTALELVAYPAESGIYRVQFVDAEYGRVAFDTYHLAAELPVGTVVYAGAA